MVLEAWKMISLVSSRTSRLEKKFGFASVDAKPPADVSDSPDQRTSRELRLLDIIWDLEVGLDDDVVVGWHDTFRQSAFFGGLGHGTERC